MSLDNIDNLVKEIADWSHRDDLGTKIPDFLLLSENAMYSNDVAVFNVRSMETVSIAATAGHYVDLPPNFD